MTDASASVGTPAAPQPAAAPEAAARRRKLRPLLGLMPFVARWRDLIKQQIPGVTTADPGFSQTKGFNDNFINDVRVTLMMEIAPLIPAMAKPTPPGEQTVQAPMRLDVAGNRLMSRAAAGFALQATGPSLYVWDIAVGRFGLVTVTDNTCSNQSLQAPTMMVMMADRMSITGNLITNEVAEPDGANVTRMALIVVPGGRVESKAQKVEINLMAVTGNTMVGRSNLQFWIRKEWANRLPAEFPSYPGGRVTEAAGSDRGACHMRVVTFTTADPYNRVLEHYRSLADRAGFSVEQQTRGGDQVLGGTRGEAAYYLIVTPTQAGSDVALIVNNGR